MSVLSIGANGWRFGVLFAAWATAWAVFPGAAQSDEPAAAGELLFESKIRPVLVGKCFACHGDTKVSGGLRVDSRAALIQGGDSGPAIQPGKVDESLLIQAIRRAADVSAMPPEKSQSLRADQVGDFAAWIRAGAPWPASAAPFEATRHWALQPVQGVKPPTVADHAWVKTPIDGFIRAKQEAAGVQPAPPADKRTLIRRVTFDLTGLPPTPEEVAAFENDPSPQAFERVIDRLLDSPAYGERWGRHWLDVVRYADTAGETADYPVPLAWRYRNYVIQSFNADKPYDEFLREQIAGDILAVQGPPERYAERVIATGYLAISRRFGFDSENYHHLTIQDTIDNLGQTVLGLSLGCARCHDHKFDAVSMTDYYGLYGIFDSSRYAFPGSEQKQKIRAQAALVPPTVSHAQWREFESRVDTLTAQLARQGQPAPPAILRSLDELDGDFELQAPAAGGSNGVLVPPWLYQGKIAVTTAAQSPFKNVYPGGRVGAHIPAGPGEYRIEQAIRTAIPKQVFVNLDFRLAPPAAGQTRLHRVTLGGDNLSPVAVVHLNADGVSLASGDRQELLAPLAPGEWYNVQLAVDLTDHVVSGSIGKPGAVTTFTRKPLPSAAGSATSPTTATSIQSIKFDSPGPTDIAWLGIELDNLAVQDAPLRPVATTVPEVAAQPELDAKAINDQLRELSGIDGDFELQTRGAPPATPWNPGPNSVVKLAENSQSPYQNIYPAGTLGVQMPNRGEYDGFGLTLAKVTPDADGRLHISFDFRCADAKAGGNGSWRYYIGHGPGPTPAIELFFNATEFFRRSGDARESVAPLQVGTWYQVRLVLDTKAKSYRGVLESPGRAVPFEGQVATGWDGAIDYSFIDSYGHLGGVRPALDADNFSVGERPLPELASPPVKGDEGGHAARRTKIAALRQQLADLQRLGETQKQELNRLLTDGPFAMAYGMSEGTPHAVRMQMRGEPDQPGVEVPRGLLKLLGGGPLPAESKGSGRLELAQWITRPDNPLTARVMVNRIWQHHFGRGLVKTPNDFGVRGRAPTHPELLDYLASEFVHSGWSIKAVHRLVLRSATYQQSCAPVVVPTSNAASAKSGLMPDANDYYASFVRRRLSAEEIRDAILAVTGELDPTPAEGHPFPTPTQWGYSQHGPFSAVYDHRKRSVYLMTQRLKRHPFLALFDGADPNATTAERLGTTVPTQALYFLNDPFVHASAEKWAARLFAAFSSEPLWLDRAYRQAWGRGPTDAELAEAAEFLAAYRAELVAAKMDQGELRAAAALLRTLLGSNEFLHVE